MNHMKHVHGQRHKSSLAEDVRWGMGYGIFMAGFYSVIAVVSLLIHGVAPLSQFSTALGSAVLFYFASGVLGGVILGILRPLTQNVFGAMLAAIPIALVALTGAWVVAEGSPLYWNRDRWKEVVFFALIVGPFFGAVRWYSVRARKNQDSH